MRFTKGDNVVYEGRQHLVRWVEDNLTGLLTPDGDYITVDVERIEGVYYD